MRGIGHCMRRARGNRRAGGAGTRTEGPRRRGCRDRLFVPVYRTAARRAGSCCTASVESASTLPAATRAILPRIVPRRTAAAKRARTRSARTSFRSARRPAAVRAESTRRRASATRSWSERARRGPPSASRGSPWSTVSSASRRHMTAAKPGSGRWAQPSSAQVSMVQGSWSSHAVAQARTGGRIVVVVVVVAAPATVVVLLLVVVELDVVDVLGVLAVEDVVVTVVVVEVDEDGKTWSVNT